MPFPFKCFISSACGGALLLLSACDNAAEREEIYGGVAREAERVRKYDACHSKGLDYFMDTGSYPTLKSAPNTGRLATDVIKERCSRTPDAFGNID
jgi:hypothetical protein